MENFPHGVLTVADDGYKSDESKSAIPRIAPLNHSRI